MGALKNIRHEMFCQKYLESGVAVEAMLYAYPSRRKWSDDAKNTGASKLLNNGKVLVRLNELREESRQRSMITRERILEELAKIAFTSVGDCHEDWGKVLDFDKLTPEQKAAIKSITARKVQMDSGEIVENVHIEMHDKIKALERICKMLGFDSPTEIAVRNANTMTREQKIAELERLEKLRKG